MAIRPRLLCLLLVSTTAGPAAWAQTSPPPEGVVSLSGSATLEVTRDLLYVSFNTTREGLDAGTVQMQLKQALDAALVEARKVARPGQLDVQTGNFSLSPRYSKNVLNGWQGTAELVVEGRDMQAIGQLSGRITTLNVARVNYGISRELQEKSENEVSGLAIAQYRARAEAYAHQFGYSGYTIREVNVSSGASGGVVRPMAMMRAMPAPGLADASLPVEPGQGTVTVNVSGTVQMTR